MKAPLLLLVPALAFSFAEAADEPRKIAMRDVATHDEIVEIARKAREENPQPVFQPAEGEDPSVVNRPADLLQRSDILCYNGIATLVPKRAILHRPKELEDRLVLSPAAGFQNWSEFLNANRSWITTVAVSRVQAEGNHPLPEETVKSFAKERRLVVAVYQDGPISVLPLKVPDTVQAPAKDTSATGASVSTPATATR